MLLTAIQFILFEPKDWVDDNDEFKVAADKMLQIVGRQLQLLTKK